jgi:glycosyltransferase involved in cell wall biosynthesis
MRFLILTQYYPPEVGAAQVRLASVARQLRAVGHAVEVVTALPNYPSGKIDPTDRGRLRRREVIDGVPVTRYWLYPATGAGVRRLVSYLSFTVTGLVGGLRARRPDVVLVESPPLFLGLAGWAIARRFGAALILNVSDLWPDSVRDMGIMGRGPWLRLAESLERWLYRHADAVTAVTLGIRHTLVATKGIPSDRALYLPNGVDPDLFRHDGAATEAALRPTILYTGNHGLAQGLDVVLDAAALVPEALFVLVGDGSDKGRLQAEVARRRLDNVRFEPPVDPDLISARYAAATAGLVCLRRTPLMEGARPAKTLAVMACGRPVIYSGSGEGADLVRAADAGVVVPPEDGAALAAAVRAVAADPRRGNEMGANGRRYVMEHLSWPALVANWLASVEQLPGSGAARV